MIKEQCSWERDVRCIAVQVDGEWPLQPLLCLIALVCFIVMVERVPVHFSRDINSP